MVKTVIMRLLIKIFRTLKKESETQKKRKLSSTPIEPETKKVKPTGTDN